MAAANDGRVPVPPFLIDREPLTRLVLAQSVSTRRHATSSSLTNGLNELHRHRLAFRAEGEVQHGQDSG